VGAEGGKEVCKEGSICRHDECADIRAKLRWLGRRSYGSRGQPPSSQEFRQ
jgi:hypothetical protein